MQILIKQNRAFVIVSILAISMKVASDSSALASYVLIACFAFTGIQAAIQALFLSWLLTMLNTGISPEIAGASVGKYLVILGAAASVLLRNLRKQNLTFRKLTFSTVMLGLLILFHSLIFSEFADVSALKIIAWTTVLVTLFSAWQSLNPKDQKILFDQIANSLMLIMLVSLPLLGVPALGYLRNGEGFQGVLNHPQSFGPTAALLGALIAGKILGEQRPRWRDIGVLGMCVGLIIASGARTAGLALILGIICSVVFCPIFAGTSRYRLLPALRSRRFQTFFIVITLVGIFASPAISQHFSRYLFKQSDSSNLLDAAEASRGELVKNMLENINKQPFLGIGFGIASNPSEMEVERDPVFGLPLSAIVEKGVMPLAVIEELGVIGAVGVSLWVFLILRMSARVGVQKFLVLITLLIINFGESMLFSVGGMGLLLLILLSGATSGEDFKNIDRS